MKSKIVKGSVAAFAVLLLVVSVMVAPASALTVFDTTGSWSGSSGVSPYGNPDTSTYGQTFIAPSESVLQNFTFYINASQGVTLQSKAYVFAWQGSLFGGGGGSATGPALFASSSFVTNGTGGYTPVTVSTGGVSLTAGNHYVMFLSISDPVDYAATTGTSFWGLVSQQAGAGDGGFVFYNNGNNVGALNTSTWDNFGDFGDLAFRAEFTAGNVVPEPSTIFLVGAGIAGLAVLRRRARR